MKNFFIIAFIIGIGAYWYLHKDGSPTVAQTTAAVGTTIVTTAPAVAAAQPASVSVGTAVAAGAIGAGFWAMLFGGGWFAAEMTAWLWVALASVVLIPFCGIAYCSDLPDDESAASGWRIMLSMALFVGMFLLLDWGGIPLWQMIKTHIVAFVGIVTVGLAIGIVWSHYKIQLRAKRCNEAVRYIFERFVAENKLDPEKNFLATVDGILNGKHQLTLERQHREAWLNFFDRFRNGLLASSGVTANELSMTFRKNKERISLWILFWPGSMARGFFTDILIPMFDKIVMSMKGIYESTMKKHAIEINYTEPPTSSGNVSPLVKTHERERIDNVQRL